MAEGYCEITFRLFLGTSEDGQRPGGRSLHELEDGRGSTGRSLCSLQDVRCSHCRMLAGRSGDGPSPFHTADATLLFIV